MTEKTNGSDDKTMVVSFRVSKSEYEELRKKGVKEKLGVGDFARKKLRIGLDLELLWKKIEEEAEARAVMEKRIMDRLDRTETRLVAEFSSMFNEETVGEIVMKTVSKVAEFQNQNKKEGRHG